MPMVVSITVGATWEPADHQNANGVSITVGATWEPADHQNANGVSITVGATWEPQLTISTASVPLISNA